MEPTPVPADVGSGDKNLALKIAAAGAAVILGLGALYIITRSEPQKKKKSKKKDKKEKEKKEKKSKKKADSDEEAEEEEDKGPLEWATEKQKPPPGRRPFDPAAAGIVTTIPSLEDAKAWMDNFHDGGNIKSVYGNLVALLAELSQASAGVTETDKEGVMRTDFDRWFLTGFIAGIIASNPALAIPQSLMVLRRMSAKEEDLTEAPMVMYAALLCSRSKEAMSTAFELWLSSQPETTLKNIKNEKQITSMFEKALTEFSEMTMSYMPLILFGSYYVQRNEALLKQAMATLEKFFEALVKSRVPEQLEGFYRGTAYAITRFGAMQPEFREWLTNYKSPNTSLKKCIKEGLTAIDSPNAVPSGPTAGKEQEGEAEEAEAEATEAAEAAEAEEEVEQQKAPPKARAAAAALARKKAAAGVARPRRTTPPPTDAQDEA